jgi:uncharacterized membrane protein
MTVYRLIAFGVAAASAAAMLYVGLYQSRVVKQLWCPLFDKGCETVANAPFARPFGIPDGFIGTGLYLAILLLLLPQARRTWIPLLVLSASATIANAVGVRDMMNLGSFCLYCLATTILSPVLLWAVWQLR